MAEQVKVFKNVNNAIPTSISEDTDVTLLTTSATESAVIKEVVFKGGSICTLDLDGFEIAKGDDIGVDGSLIMGPSSTLKVISSPLQQLPDFKGMFFAAGSTGIQFLQGSGIAGSGLTQDITPTQVDSNAQSAYSACAARLNGELFFYALQSPTLIEKYNVAGELQTSWASSGSGYQMTTDQEYIYHSSTSASSSIYRTKLSDLSTDTLTTTSAYNPPGSNQGSYFLYHNGKIYSKRDGGSVYIDVINLSDLSVRRIADSNFDVGSYSDGACVVTTLAGVSYIVEQGTDSWSYFNLETEVVNKVGSGSNSSTEYGNGGGQIAPGVALIFGEQSDRATIIDMNVINRLYSPNEHGFTTSTSYSNRFAFAGYLVGPPEPYTYNAFATGVLITDIASERVEVFKNINSITPTTTTADIDVNLLTTSATESAVIKDIVFKGGTVCTLKMDGTEISKGSSIAVEGNLIMGPSSTLDVTSSPFREAPDFKGMFFAGGSTGIQFLEGNGTDTNITPTQLSSDNQSVTSVAAARLNGELFFYVSYGASQLAKYNTSGELISSWSLLGAGYQITTDGEYLYRSRQGTSTIINRTKLSDLSVDDITTTSTYKGPTSNTGSYFLHHNGKLYSKYNGDADELYIIDLSDLSVRTITDSNFEVGTYSDGACVVTTTANVSYIVEQGNDNWSYFNLETEVVTLMSGGSNSSTEYGNGGGEIAPGIALTFGQSNERVSVIDMNTITRTENTVEHGFTTSYDYGTTFAFGGYLKGQVEPYTYNAFAAGILITDLEG
jgi:hypothetical protein